MVLLKLMIIKRFLVQTIAIVLMSLCLGIIFNFIHSDPLPILKSYNPFLTGDTTSDGENLMIDEIDSAMLKKLQKTGQIILLDARDEPEFQMEHIPSALNLPLNRFEAYYRKLESLLRKNRLIVTYCSEETCTDALLLAGKLFKRGFRQVFVYREGIREWIQSGYQTKRGDGKFIPDDE